MSFILKYRKYIQENIGLSLFGFNLFLLAVVFSIYDPFDIIPEGYDGSSPVINISQKNVKKISFNTDGNNFSLIRKEKIEEKKDENPLPLDTEKDSALFNEKKEAVYEWSLEINSDNSKLNYSADPERVETLFKEIKEARRYYSFSMNAENEIEMGFSKNQSGECSCLKITFLLENDDQHTLYVGRSTAGGESHVRLDEESKIYLVRNDLQASSGYGKSDHFRNRRLLPGRITADSITSINAKFAVNPARNVSLSRAGGRWMITTPVQGSARIGTLPEDIADMKADQFPKLVPPDMNTENAFKLEVVYKKSLTELKSITFDILGSKEQEIYYIKDENGILYQIYSYSIKDLFHPEENLLEKESILEKTN